MNNIFHIVGFCLLLILCTCNNISLGQTKHTSGNAKKDSIESYILKRFRLDQKIKLSDYDTVVVLNTSLLALGRGRAERYREYIIINKLGEILQKKVTLFGNFQFKEGALSIVTRYGEGFLLETGNVAFPCTLHGSEDFKGGIAHINVEGNSLPGIDYRKSKKETPYHYKGEINPFHILDNYVNRRFELMIPKYYDSIAPYRDGKIRMVMKKGLFGFLDTTGHEVVTPILTDFDEEDQFNWQHLRRVQHKGLFGFVDDHSGQQIIPFEYEATVASTYPFTWVRKAGKWGCINQAGTQLIPFVYDAVSYFDADSISIVGRNGHMGHIRANGAIATPLLYESAQPFAEGLALVSQEGRYGYVNHKGQLVIPAVYAYASSFHNGYATVERFGIKATIDKQGNWVTYRLGTGWNLSIVLFFLMLVLFIAYRRSVF